MRLPIKGLTRTPGEAPGVLLESHFPGARINRGPERSLNITKTGANSIDWHNGKEGGNGEQSKVGSEHIHTLQSTWSRWYLLKCLQKGLDPIIKYFN